MSAPTSTAFQWPAEVLEMARKHELEGYLNPLLEMTRRLFPTATSLRVYVDRDRELRDVWSIAYEVTVTTSDVTDYNAANYRWIREAYGIVPAPLICNFILLLFRLAS